MTKWFTYFPDKPEWTLDDFFQYFEDEENAFESWLATSYEMAVCGEELQKVTAFMKNGEASFTIILTNGFCYPAGKEVCLCATDLWNQFVDRIDDYKKYIKEEI